MPAPPSVFGGFTLTERIGVDPFGETFAAVGPGGRKARVRRIDVALGKRTGFGQTLLAGGQRLAVVEHPHVVSTIAIGRDAEGTLTVVVAAHANAVTLEACLRDARVSGARASQGVALHIARAVAHALDRAHRAHVVHGGVHPRSVWIDEAGDVRLGDFGIAHALAIAAEEDFSLLQGMQGYVAPELALGDAVDARSDVYGVGALLHELLTGAPPPGMIDAPPPLIDVCERLAHTDPERRIADGTAAAAALDDVAAKLDLRSFGRTEVAAFVAQCRGAAERSLDDDTEGFLADLASSQEEDTRVGNTPLPAPLPSHEFPSGSFAALSSASGLLTNVASSPADGPLDRSATDSDVSPLLAERDTTGDAKRRDPSDPAYGRDRKATASLFPIDDVRTPTPALEPRFEGSIDVHPQTPVPQQLPPASTRPLRLPTPSPTPLPAPTALTPVTPATMTPAAQLAARSGQPPRAKTASIPPPVVAGPPPASMFEPTALRTANTNVHPTNTGVWIVIMILSLGALGFVLYTRTDVFHPGRRADKKRQAEAAVAAAKERAAAGAPRQGDLVIESNPPDSAVWMLLGKTPLDTTSSPMGAMDVAAVRELRIESDGFVPADVVVPPAKWTGTGTNMRAAVKVTLTPAPVGWVAPAAPPEPPPSPPSDRKGTGNLHIDSEPSGAEVWLLVGFTTPEARINSVYADKDVELRIAHDGYAPVTHVVKTDEWADGRKENRIVKTLTPRPVAPAKP